MARRLKKAPAPKKEKVDAPVLTEEPVVAGDAGEAASVKAKPCRKKCGREVELILKVPGYVPKASRVVDIDKLNAAERAALLDELIDSLIEQMK